MFDRFRRRPAENVTPESAEPSAQQSLADPGVEESYSVDEIANDRFNFGIYFLESVPWEEEERIDKLAELLDGLPEIERAFREDREFILIEAPGLERSALVVLVALAWEEAAVGTQYRRFNDEGDLVDAERPSQDH